MGERHEETDLSPKEHTHGKQACENTFNIICQQGKATNPAARDHLTPMRMTHKNCWQRGGEAGSSRKSWWKQEMWSHPGQLFGSFLYN